jgi:hypothetical protein
VCSKLITNRTPVYNHTKIMTIIRHLNKGFKVVQETREEVSPCRVYLPLNVFRCCLRRLLLPTEATGSTRVYISLGLAPMLPQFRENSLCGRASIPGAAAPFCLCTDGVVGIATGYGMDDGEVGVRVPVGSRVFSSPRRPDRLWGPPNLLSDG